MYEYNIPCFDASDIDYLSGFTQEQLKAEIASTHKHLNRETEWEWQAYYQDYLRACQLALKMEEPVTTTQFNNTESIESIKARIDLADYISQYTQLRRIGNKFKGKCPVHHDRQDSFFVYPDGHFYCYSCVKGGDLIDFVEWHDNVDTKEAIRRLSK